MFPLKIKEGRKPYQAPARYFANAQQQLFKEEPERLQKHQIAVLLGVDKLSE